MRSFRGTKYENKAFESIIGIVNNEIHNYRDVRNVEFVVRGIDEEDIEKDIPVTLYAMFRLVGGKRYTHAFLKDEVEEFVNLEYPVMKVMEDNLGVKV